MRLPDHLELLLTDEPVLDVYGYGPWRVPDGLYEEIAGRVETLAGDARCAGWTTDQHRVLAAPTSLVVADLLLVIEFLGGAGAVRGGTRSKLHAELLGRYFTEPVSPDRAMTGWQVGGARWRPPLEWLVDAPDPGAALEVARELLEVVAGIEPFEERRQALLKLYETGPRDALNAPLPVVRERWARSAGDEILAALPELAGPIGYLEWACAGLIAAHENVLAAAPRDEPVPALLAHLLLQADLSQVPAELSIALGEDLYGELNERFAAEIDDFAPHPWYEGARSWLARGLVGGAVDGCRGWLDMAMRFTACVQGLPDVPRTPEPEWIPVGEFQTDLRRLFGPRRRVANPLAARLGTPAAKATTQSTAPAPSFATKIVDQPEVVAALEDIADGASPVRLLLVGPDGTGKRDAAQEVAALLEHHEMAEGALWLADDFFAGKTVADATTSLHTELLGCAGERMVVIDGLDDLAKDPRSGEAVVEELHRFLDVHEDLHVVALTEPGGDDRIREVNPALLLRFQVARTRPFTAEGHAELFRRAIESRGAKANKNAVEAAGKLLVRTPAVRNLRNARLSQRLADVVVEAVRGRTAPAADLVVRRKDIPAALDPSRGGDPMAELAALIGLDSVKREIDLLVAGAQAARLRRDAGLPAAAPSRHMVFTGNPGTGKTVVARLLARVFKDLGVLSSGHLVEASRSQLIGEYIGETATKTRQVAQRALGGVLFVDEAYALTQSELADDYGPEAVAELLKIMEDHRDDLVVIVAGYEREMQRFVSADPGLASRFPTTLRFSDFADDELVEVFRAQADQAGLTLGEGVEGKVRGLLRRAPRGRSFGNARLMRNLHERATALQAKRVVDGEAAPAELAEIRVEDIPDTLSGLVRTAPPGDPLADLDALVGLAEVKKEVRQLVAEARTAERRRTAGMPQRAPVRHMVFTGNPGTGKTIVARLMAQIYARLGLLSSGHLVEVTRADLVGGYLGQTAPKVEAAVEQAVGGVLFVDEAYSLTQGDDNYGREAVAALVKQMEDRRGDLMVIVAGYEKEMADFLAANPGLESRFPKKLAFPDYTDDELAGVFALMAAEDGFTLAGGVAEGLRGLLGRTTRTSSFGNGRLMRNVLDAAVARQAQRLTSEDPDADVTTLVAADLPGALEKRDESFGLYL